MTESEAALVKQEVRVYVMVFTALAGLTVVTVAISYLHLPTVLAISVALVVATVKAGLVASYFMHLISEEKVILWLLLLCAAFLVALMALPVGTETGIAPLWPFSS
ncbi:MAG: cytochrome C oxidase subunit IV family protein [Myxococcales bacterium]|nr:cytochrome C oxidase subunit IV family protein [Myxococcales bacterium]TDI99613.1 MAG: cytochrome-c oxidase [Deltaproteobacteria bacterium]